MMRILNSLIILMLMGLFLTACGNHQEPKQVSEVNLDGLTKGDTSLLNVAEALADSDEVGPEAPHRSLKRQFVRTADVKCRVADVVQMTGHIERMVVKQGGFVTNTTLNSETNGTDLVPVSADSSLETTHYTISSTLTLRVPNLEFDSTLWAISQLADLVEHRAINTEDVAIELLAAEQTRRRNKAYDARLRRAIGDGGRRLDETTQAEASRLAQQAQTDEARQQQYVLHDQLRFSTVTLSLYQRPLVRRVVLASLPDPRAYEPGFLAQATEALGRGGYVLKQAVLLLLEGWGLIAFVVGAFILYRYVIAWRKPMVRN